MAATIAAIPPGTLTRKVGTLMVLSPRSTSHPKLLLKPGRWTVGSAATCSFRIAADGVRPRHALLLCGGQRTLLKAWDANTWHNDRPVLGEVQLEPGDRVTIGTVEFAVEPAGPSEIVAQLPDVPRKNVDSTPPAVTPIPAPDGWDLEKLRGQIQELRDELSQRVLRRPGTVAPPPATNLEPARISELEQAAADARQRAERAQQELTDLRAELTRRESEWQTERDRQAAEAHAREHDWEQQVSAWTAEREQWQQELVSLSVTRQQMLADWEHQRSTLQTEAARWQTECEELRADWQQHQSAWSAEHARLLEESLKQEDAAQQARLDTAQREQELAEQARQLAAERDQLEAERQQLQALRRESDQALADLSAERERVEQNAAEVLEKFEDFSRRTAEFEQQQAQLTRDQQVLEHSWNWLQTDRRKLVEEKSQWQDERAALQAERENLDAERAQFQQEREEVFKNREALSAEQESLQPLVSERQQFEADRAAWTQQREQWEAEWQSHTAHLEAAHAELQSQQQTLEADRDQLQSWQVDLNARAAAVAIERQTLDADRQTFADERQAWEDNRVAWNAERPPTHSSSRALVEGPLESLSDPWSIGVDLTAPRTIPDFDSNNESPSSTDWSVTTETISLADSTSLARFWRNDPVAMSGRWDVQPRCRSLAEFVTITDSAAPKTPTWESPPAESTENRESNAEASDPEAAELRRELAELFQLQGLRAPTPEKPVPTPVANGPVVSVLESMAFTEDEDVDDSVSRYMQHLLARTQQPGAVGRERYVPIPNSATPGARSDFSPLPSVDEAGMPLATKPPITVSEIELPAESALPERESPSSAKLRTLAAGPIHRQDKHAIREATERMRQVANQQTLKNVQAANWTMLKVSIKTKSALAAFAFVLSAGLLALGYYYQPDFLALGVCASGLGVMTWVDLFIAIREARRRTAQLTGRKRSM